MFLAAGKEPSYLSLMCLKVRLGIRLCLTCGSCDPSRPSLLQGQQWHAYTHMGKSFSLEL